MLARFVVRDLKEKFLNKISNAKFFLTKELKYFLLLVIIILLIQFFLLRIVLQFGFTADDWLILFDYKTFGGNVNFLNKFLISMRAIGLYHTYQIMYIGFFENLYKDNYIAYHITDIAFKALATISLYPLIMVVFKRRLLAFLTTILYGISYSSTGALIFVCTGGDYLAIFLMNVFLINYFYYFTMNGSRGYIYHTKRALLLFSATSLLFLSFMASPIRIFPLLACVIIIEIFLWIKSRKFSNLKPTSIGILLLFLPFIVLFFFAPTSTESASSGPMIIYNFLYHGNYQLLLVPIAGIGYTFLTNSLWPIFGNLTIDNFSNYLLFLIHGPLIIYSILAILIGFLFTKKPIVVVIGIIFSNLVFELVIYFLIINVRGLTGPNAKGFYLVSTYAIYLGFFIISIAVAGLYVWLRSRRPSSLLLPLFIGILFSNIFMWGTWLIRGDNLTFIEGVHRYSVVASIGSSLFLASFFVIMFDKIKLVRKLIRRYISFGVLFLLFLSVFLISKMEINSYFTDLLNSGYGAFDQEVMKSRLLSYTKNPLVENPTLFYFEAQQNQIFYPLSPIYGFGEDLHFRNSKIVNGCIGVINDRNILEKSVTMKDGAKGFNANSLCVDIPRSLSRPDIYYKRDNFFAFKLSGKDMIDIKEKVLKELGF